MADLAGVQKEVSDLLFTRRKEAFLLIPTISEPKVFYLLALSKKVFNLLAFGEISQRGQETFCILEVKRPFCSFLHK